MGKYVYDVYDNRTDMPLIIGGTAEECARRLGIKQESFLDYVKKQKNIKRTVIRTVPDYGESFGERLRIARDKKGFSRAELARIAGIHPTTLRSYESGARQPNLKIAADLAAALGVTIQYLAGEGDYYE